MLQMDGLAVSLQHAGDGGLGRGAGGIGTEAEPSSQSPIPSATRGLRSPHPLLPRAAGA